LLYGKSRVSESPIGLTDQIAPRADAIPARGYQDIQERYALNSGFQQLGIQPSKMYWLLGSKSQLSIESKLLLYKAILKAIWTCGVQFWGTAANSNIEIIQRFQNKYFRIIVHLGTSPMILYTTISTYHTLETRLKSSIRDGLDCRQIGETPQHTSD